MDSNDEDKLPVPEEIGVWDVEVDGPKDNLLVFWDGNGYNIESCWIQSAKEDVVNLQQNL